MADTRAAAVIDAMVCQIAKVVGAMAVVPGGEADFRNGVIHGSNIRESDRKADEAAIEWR